MVYDKAVISPMVLMFIDGIYAGRLHTNVVLWFLYTLYPTSQGNLYEDCVIVHVKNRTESYVDVQNTFYKIII